MPSLPIMKLSDKGKKFIQNAEGLRLRAYICSAGKLTIGYGHRIKPSEMAHLMGRTITPEEAVALFEADVQNFVNAINELVKVKLTQNKFDALVAFIFNIGINAFRASTLRRDINTGLPLATIEHEWKRWVHDDHGSVIQGLVLRRGREFDLFKQAA